MISSALSGSMPSMWAKRCDKTVLRIPAGAFGARAWKSGNAFDQQHALFPVNFIQANFYDFGVAGLHRPADESGLDRKFAVPALDQHAQTHAFRTAEVKQTVHGGANRTSRVKHIVDENQILVVHRERDLARLQDGLRGDFREIVAIQRDVQRSHRDIHAVDASHGLRNPVGQRNAPAAHSNQSQIRRATAFFHDFMGQTLHGTGDFRRRHQLRFFYDEHWAYILTYGPLVSKSLVKARRV